MPGRCMSTSNRRQVLTGGAIAVGGIAWRFELLDPGPGTRIVFDHSGFPAGKAEHLAAGWHAHYWEPLEKILATG